jgi:aldose 1-epimerase
MTDKLSIETNEAIVDVLPALGGALAAFDLKTGATRTQILRRWSGEIEDPRYYASSPMVPWFNRISGGGFSFGGKFYPVAPNFPHDPVPIHGDGWLTAWEVAEHAPTRIALRLRSRAIPPWDYEATQTYSLSGSTLEMELAVVHRGATPLPYGLGQHPWFPRTPAVTIEAKAGGMWLEQPPEFPPSPTPTNIPAKWDFSRPHPLPEDLVDNGFAGWNGRARIAWPDRGVAVDIEADAETHFYQIYAPGPERPYFCFEPVTHPNNALAFPEKYKELGIRVLAPGERTAASARLTATRS